MTSYGELFKVDPVFARKRLIEIYNITKSIRKTAHISQTDRKTVRKVLRLYKEKGEEGLKPKSKRPKKMPNKTPEEIEKMIIEIRKKTKWGVKRIKRALYENKKINISCSTIYKILKRNNLNKSYKRFSYVKKKVNCFYADKFKPFEMIQVDLKEILDLKTLPFDVYRHIYRNNFPRYQWTAIDVKTRMRFLCFSYEKTFEHGFKFLELVVSWIRSMGFSHKIYIQTDNGEEWGGKSLRKFKNLNKYFSKFNVELKRIPKGKKEYNAFVERSHRTDDEEFYIPYIKQVKNIQDFLTLAKWWIYYYNTYRMHFGKNLKGKTPYSQLSQYHKMPKNLSTLPPLILEHLPPGVHLRRYYNISAYQELKGRCFLF